MKNQYFGDDRDLFKYDLVLQIIKEGLVSHFTFIPMLTKNDDSGQGKVRNRKGAGTKNEKLKDFLDKFGDKSTRNIKRLEGFFKKKDIGITIYEKNKYFSKEQRKEYFKQIRDNLLCKSLILVDPDKGLKIENPTEEYILYSEVKDLYKRMDSGSLLMIFQYRPRTEKWKDCCRRISEQLKKEVGNSPIYISDDPSVFLFLTKENESLRESLSRVIEKYREAYHLK